MAFNLVYQSLIELFPEVDARILKAVAIEHSRDPDGAVNSIYTEVLPFISKQSNIPSTTVENNVSKVESTNARSSTMVSIAGKGANAYDNFNHELNSTSLCMNETLDDALTSSSYDANDFDSHLSTKNKNETEILLGECHEVEAEAKEGKKSDASVSSSGKCSEDNFYRPFRNHTSEAVAPPHQFKDVRVDKIVNNNVGLSTIVTHSGQTGEIDLLQDTVENAKNYKATLLPAMENVTAMMKEVELKEKEAEDAKEAAARGGLEILKKMGELMDLLKHAKEAKDMHAGELHGEKSILATEAQELQIRLLGLSDEKEKSLSILEQMRQTLEARLAVAEKVKIAAQKELLQKEENARAVLAEQELIMEKAVQESKVLQQEAEENTKLHDFLTDKGRLVDTLQGEISVICRDVKLLKENFNNRVPFSNSRQTDFYQA